MHKNLYTEKLSFIRLVPFLLLLVSAALTAQEPQEPYRWLEDSQDPRTEEWLNTQQNLFKQYIEPNPYRAKIKESLNRLLNYDSYTIPVPCGGLYFFKMRLPGENQPVLYVQEGIKGTPRVLLDPNQLSIASPVSLTNFVPSPDGKWLAYGLAESGSDWTTWKVLKISSGENQTDCLEKIKFFPVAWSPDCQGFYYSRVDHDDVYRIYYHALGNLQASDALIYENLENREYFPSPAVSSDQKYLLVNLERGSSGPNAILYRPLNQAQMPFLTLLPMTESNHSYLCNEGATFYCWTNQEADLGKVIAVDAETGVQTDIIPESRCSLDHVIPIGNYFAARFSDDVISRLVLFNRQGRELRDIPLPGMGTAVFVEAPPSLSVLEDELFFSFTNFVQPPLIYHYAPESGRLEIFKQPKLTFNPHDYQTRQVFFSSKDGTRVPLFIVHKKGIALNGNNQTLLYAYGGFGIPANPNYHTLHMAWLESGGVFALANIRGGGEYGNQWHEGGKREKKQNCFDDFISAAEWLIGSGYTNPSKLAIRGASNGGLLTAVCLNQRPDLFGAALVEVGVLDMLRFHLFTVGRFWMEEYGNPQDPEDFKVLSRYSPYHHVRRDASYPSVLIVTGDHDDRVVPLHSYKYTAAMQEACAGKSPVLLRVDRQGGHGAGKSIAQWEDEAADILSFLKQELN